MKKLFNKILLPVDFSSASKIAVEKAVEIAKQYSCSIHLLNATSLTPYVVVGMSEGYTGMPYSLAEDEKEKDFQLGKLSKYIHFLSAGMVRADYSIISGSWDEVIIQMVEEYGFDLVIIGQDKDVFVKKNSINADNIASKTDIPVITVPSNRRLARLCTIAVPVTDFLPVRKLMYGIYMAAAYNATLKLMGVQNEKTKDKVQHYMNRAFKLVRDNCGIKVEMQTITGKDVAHAFSNAGLFQSSDLMIVNPGSQPETHGLLSHLFRNIGQKYSVPPVLIVTPI